MSQPTPGTPAGQDVISLGAGIAAAKKLRQLFERSYLASRWETCGWIRRQRREGPAALRHVVIPRPAPPESPWCNELWHRAADLLSTHQLEPAILPGGTVSSPDADTVALEVQLGGVRHTIVRTTAEAWGSRLAEWTGPLSYWRMLLWRLRAAGTIKLHQGLPCVINRSGTREQLEPIACYTEADFFRLARTRYREPRERFDQIVDGNGQPPEWKRGIHPEWYPPGVRVYVSPAQRELFDTSKAVDPRHVGRDAPRWRWT